MRVREFGAHHRGALCIDRWTSPAFRLPAFVLLDLKMPRIDGLEVWRQIKSDAQLDLTPVVMLTSSREESDLIPQLPAGRNAYVVKPVELAEFVDAIRQIGAFWAGVNATPHALPVEAS